MKKILFILGMYLPRQSANGICCEQVVKKLVGNGYDVTCIVNDAIGSLQQEELNGAHIYRIKPRLSYRLLEISEIAPNSLKSKAIKLFANFLNKVKNILFAPFWPLKSPLYTYRFYKMAKKLHKLHQYNAVVSVYTPIDSLLAGHYFKKKYPDIKFVPYFLDSLSGGHGPKIFSKKRIINVGKYWEKKTLSNADKVIVMKSSEKHHRQYNAKSDYYKKLVYLDIPLMSEVNKVNADTKYFDNTKINIVYMGLIPYPVRNPEFTLRIFGLLKTENVVLTFVGDNNCPDVFKKAQQVMGERLRLLGPVSHKTAREIGHQADFLINIGNNNPSMVSSKIFEYMSLGKPIISTYPIEDEPCIPYLKTYPASLLLNENDPDDMRTVKHIEEFICKYNKTEIDYETIKSEFFDNTPVAFVKQIDNLFDDKEEC